MSDWDWKFINSFAPWLSAVGTLTSATIALFLGLRKPKAKLRCACSKYLILEPGRKNENPDKILKILIVNEGHVPVTVTGFGFSIGWRFTKWHTYFIIPDDPIYQDRYTIRLDHAERAEFNRVYGIWLASVAAIALPKKQDVPKCLAKNYFGTLRGYVYSTTGTSEFSISKEILDEIHSTYLKSYEQEKERGLI